jgi:soluble lytic murein transglycosylase
MPTLSATILTPRPRSTASGSQSMLASNPTASPRADYLSRALAIAVSFALLAATPVDLPAAQTVHKKRKSNKTASKPCQTGCSPNTSAPEITAATPEDEAAQRELSSLARSLHNAIPGAYDKLAAFAGKNAGNVWGARAALALGYDDYNKNHSQQALVWLTKAKSDTLLGDYVLYWTAQTQRVLKQNAPAFAELQTLQTEYPNTGIKEQFLEAYAPSAMEAGKPQAAIDALDTYTGTTAKPALLLLRAQAYKQARQFGRAAKDYQLLYYKNPLSDEGKTAASGLQQVKSAMGSEYPAPSWDLQEGRAQILFNQKKYRDAQTEFTKLAAGIKDPSSAHKQHAFLRAAQTRVQLKGSPSLVSSLNITDPEVDAERMYVVAQIARSANKEPDMLADTEAVLQKYPQSKWSEEALMMVGNYYWVQLNRHEAIKYYQRVVDNFPSGKYTFFCEWRTAWIAYLDRQPYADDRLTAFLRKYPTSADAPDALYWLGRNAERSGNPGHARAYFTFAVNRWPQTYFGHAAAARLEKLGAGDQDAPDFLAAIPPAPVLRSVDEPVPDTAKDRWVRAQALRIIAFDASAELELKAGFFATGSPRLLFEAAQCAFDQGHFATGMSYGRLIVPNFDSRKIPDVPPNVWKTIFPLPYEASLRREAQRNDFDPMLAAGLIRQESTFQADIVSHANAVGLMQVLPKTGKLLAKQLKVRYTKAKLFDPEYNLELGMLYIAGLLKATGEPEYALAAFNAGEDRIAAWRAERNYEEIAELVESIPFTETRDYVQIVMRNADVYRQVYGPGATQTPATSTATTTIPPAPAPVAPVAPVETTQPEQSTPASADATSDPNHKSQS